MKINILLPGFGLTGGVRVILKYGELLTNRGHDVVMYTQILAHDVKRGKCVASNTYFRAKHTIHRILDLCILRKQKDIRGGFQTKAVWKMNENTIRDGDVTIATAWPTAYDLLGLTEKKGRKIYFIQDFETWNNYQAGLETYSFPFCQIVISEWINSMLRKTINKHADYIVYDGIDLETFHANRTRFYEKGDICNCLMLYHPLKKKGFEIGLEAFKKVCAIYPQCKLTLFGMDMPPELPDGISFVYQASPEEMQRLYAHSDIYIFPPITEGWGLTPLEAMACQCAVVASKAGCMQEIGHNMENAVVVEPGSSEKIAQGIIRLIENPDLLKQIAINGYMDVQKYSWSQCVERLEKILLTECKH